MRTTRPPDCCLALGTEELFAALESRTLMTASVSWVGIDLSLAGPSVVLGEGILGDDSSVTGAATIASLAGSQSGLPIDIASIAFGENGGMSFTRPGGVAPFVGQSGTDFRLSPSGYELGTHVGTYADGDGIGEFDRYVVERRSVFSTLRSTGRLIVRTTEITAAGVSYAQRGIDVTIVNGAPTAVTLYRNPLASKDISSDPGTVKLVTSWTADGVITFGNGEKLIFTRGNSVLGTEEQAIYFDPDAGDGRVSIGVAFNKSSFTAYTVPTENHPTFTYRGFITAKGPEVRALLGIPADSTLAGQTVVLTLAADGKTFALFRAEEFDMGGAHAVWSGVWATSGLSELYSLVPSPNDFVNQIQYLANQLILTDADKNQIVFSRTQGFGLAPAMFRAPHDLRETLGGGLGSPGFVFPRPVVEVAPEALDIDSDGHPIVYALEGSGDSSIWHREDLLDVTGGVALAAGQISVSPGDRHTWTVVGISSDGSVVLYQIGKLLSNFSAITFSDQTADPDSAVAGLHFGAGAVVFLSGGDGIATIGGRTLDGRLVVAELLSINAQTLAPQWRVTDVSAALATHGQDVPDWTGQLSGYSTQWGAVNIAGFDADGEMQVVWTAPGVATWYANNLSLISSAPAMSGRITTLVTGWRSIQMHAIGVSGDLISVWWAPELVGDWRFQNLTAEAGGVKLASTDHRGRDANMVAWMFGNTLNVATIDRDGNSQVYWWSMETDRWSLTKVNPPFDPQSLPTALVDGARDVHRYLHHQYFALNSQDELLRVYWQGSPTDEWIIENVGRGAI